MRVLAGELSKFDTVTAGIGALTIPGGFDDGDKLPPFAGSQS